jgi:hypothetical protein
MKYIFFSLFFFLFLGAGFYYFFYKSSEEKNTSSLEKDSLFFPFENNTYSVSENKYKEEKIPLEENEKESIFSEEKMIENLKKEATDLEYEGWYVLEDNERFYISFLDHQYFFWIIIKQSPIDPIRVEIEDFLHEKIDVERKILCLLAIDVVVEGQFSDNREAIDVGLPSCEGPHFLHYAN